MKKIFIYILIGLFLNLNIFSNHENILDNTVSLSLQIHKDLYNKIMQYAHNDFKTEFILNEKNENYRYNFHFFDNNYKLILDICNDDELSGKIFTTKEQKLIIKSLVEKRKQIIEKNELNKSNKLKKLNKKYSNFKFNFFGYLVGSALQFYIGLVCYVGIVKINEWFQNRKIIVKNEIIESENQKI